jgi:hypothetical protein
VPQLGAVLAFALHECSSDTIRSKFHKAIACLGLANNDTKKLTELLYWYSATPRREARSTRKLAVVGVFPRLFPIWCENSSGHSERFEGFLRYFPSVDTPTYLFPDDSDLWELGFGCSRFPNNWKLRDVIASPATVGVPTVILQSSGRRNFYSNSLDEEFLVAEHECKFIEAISGVVSRNEWRHLENLTPATIFCRDAPTPETLPCFTAYFVNEDESTETRFAFIQPRQAKIASLGTLLSSRACPVQHPLEFSRSIFLLERALERAA